MNEVQQVEEQKPTTVAGWLQDKEFREYVKKYIRANTDSIYIPDFDIPEKARYLKFTVRKANYPVKYNELQAAEWIKCSRDPFYFIEKYCKVISVDDGLVSFKLYPFQKEMIRNFQNNRFSITNTARQMGKAVSLDTPILTPNGFTTMGQLNVGDIIYGPDGKPTNINYITDNQYNKKVYKITFDNGEVVKACEDHIWRISTNDWQRYSKKNRNITTNELLELLENTGNKSSRPFIEITNPVEFDERELDVHPYILGLWLGDGDSSSGTITCLEEDYNHYGPIIKSYGYDISIFRKDKRNNSGRFTIYGLSAQLKKLGVFGNKHIPKDYIFNSVTNRQWLMKGLMDSDGYASEHGRLEFYQSNELFIDDVRIILSSLGIKTRKRSKETGYKVAFKLMFVSNDMDMFTLPRKLERQHENKNHPKNKRIYVCSIEEIESEPVRCLQVDNDDHMFLCGKTLIPTHNTTVVAGYILWYSIFHEDKLIFILANKAAQSKEIVSRIRLMFENIPYFLQPGVFAYNKTKIELGNRSVMESAATSSSSIRGRSCSLLYLDELAFVAGDMEFYESTYPVISSGKTSKVLITSTPNGARGLFYKIWKESETNVNRFKRLEVPWHMHPERDEEWAKETRRNMGSENQWLQEFCCKFLSSSGTLIDAMTLERTIFANPIEETTQAKIFEYPEEGHSYVITVDCSRGVGLDNQAFIVIDVTELPYKVVMTFRDNKVPYMFYPNYIHSASITYNNAQVLIELNDIGEAVANILYEDLENENILFTVSAGRGGQKLDDGFGTTSKPGIKTSTTTKALGCATLKTLVESDKIILNDSDIVSELMTFIAKGKSYEAEEGCKDDLAMCLVLFAWLQAQQHFKDMVDLDSRRKMTEERQNQLLEEMAPFGGILDGLRDDIESEPIMAVDVFGWDGREDMEMYEEVFFEEFKDFFREDYGKF